MCFNINIEKNNLENSVNIYSGKIRTDRGINITLDNIKLVTGELKSSIIYKCAFYPK
jgi:hypothetical protein